MAVVNQATGQTGPTGNSSPSLPPSDVSAPHFQLDWLQATVIFPLDHPGQINMTAGRTDAVGGTWRLWRDDSEYQNELAIVRQFDIQGNQTNEWKIASSKGKIDSASLYWRRNRDAPVRADLIVALGTAEPGRTNVYFEEYAIVNVGVYATGMIDNEPSGPGFAGIPSPPPVVGVDYDEIQRRDHLESTAEEVELRGEFGGNIRQGIYDKANQADTAALAAYGALRVEDADRPGTSVYLMRRQYQTERDAMVGKTDGGVLYEAYVQACYDAIQRAVEKGLLH